MQGDSGVVGIAHVIQLAVAPVFLLSGLGAMLAVLTSRLARAVDRARLLEEQRDRGEGVRESIDKELVTTWQRAQIVNRAIALCTTAALLVCALIAILFLAAFLNLDASRAIAALFVLAILAFSAGLIAFLAEIALATKMLRASIERAVPRRT